MPSASWAVLEQGSAIESEAAKEDYLIAVDTAGAEVVVRCVRTSLAATVHRRAVGRPRERDLQQVTWRR